MTVVSERPQNRGDEQPGVTDDQTPTATRRAALRAGGAVAAGVLGSVAGCARVRGLPADPTPGPAGPAAPTGATATFRGGLARRGFYPDRPAPVDPAVAWSRPVNTGDHTAAKSSAVPLRPGRGDDAVVVGGDTGRLYAIDGDGVLLWTADTAEATRGIHGTPTVAGDTVYVGAYDGALYAFDRATGRRRWRVRLGDAIGSSPAYHDGLVYVAVEYVPADGSLFAVDARDGSVVADLGWPGDHPHSTAALSPAADRVVVGANDGGCYAWRLSDHERAWSVGTDGPVKGPVALYDGAAFVGSWDHGVYRIDLATGTVDWRFAADDMVMSGPAVDPRRDTLYVGSHDRSLYGLDVETGDQRFQYDTDGWIIGCPSVLGDRVAVGAYDQRLHAVTPGGDLAWTVGLVGRVTASPRVVDGTLHVATRATDEQPGRTYAIR